MKSRRFALPLVLISLAFAACTSAAPGGSLVLTQNSSPQSLPAVSVSSALAGATALIASAPVISLQMAIPISSAALLPSPPVALAAPPRSSVSALAYSTPADISALSSALGKYLAPFGTRVGVSVIDAVTGQAFGRNQNVRFIMASSMKVILMLATLDRAERSHTSLSAYQRSLMVAMIEQSDNNAASYFYGRLGAAGVAAYLHRIGLAGWQVYGPVPSWWGYSSLTPATMTALLARLDRGQILTATDRAYALYLMRHVTAWERFGVGDTAPTHAIVAMKNGWVPGPDGRWAVNSSGIVVIGGRTWIVSVYTRANSSYAGGVYIVRHVAALVAAAMMSRK